MLFLFAALFFLILDKRKNRDVKTKAQRPCELLPEQVDAIIQSHASEIFVNSKVVCKEHPIWETMSEETGRSKKTCGFYSHFMDNRNYIRTRIEGNISNIYSSLSPDSTHDLFNMNNSTIDKHIKIVVIRFTHQEFVELLQVNDYKRSGDARPGLLLRQYTSFVPGAWQQAISEKLWGQKITHGFNFKTHKISYYAKTASFKYNAITARY